MTPQEILQLLDEKRVLTAPAAVAWDEVQRQQNRLNRAAKRLNGPITVTMALNLLFAFTIFLLKKIIRPKTYFQKETPSLSFL